MPCIPAADVLIFRLPGARVVLRPSGTEPKIKCYIEIVEPLGGRSLPAARGLAAERLAPLRHALQAVLVNACEGPEPGPARPGQRRDEQHVQEDVRRDEPPDARDRGALGGQHDGSNRLES